MLYIGWGLFWVFLGLLVNTNDKEKKKRKIYALSAVLSLLLLFISIGVTGATTASVAGNPYGDYSQPTLAPTPIPTPYTGNLFYPTIAPTTALAPTPEETPAPSWLYISVIPSAVYFNEPIYVTVQADCGGFYATLHWQGDGGLNNWINEEMQLWIDPATNTGTQEFAFSPEGQYTFTVSADDESASATCYVSIPPY